MECAICLEIPVDPYTPKNCNHYYCKACFERIHPNNGSLLCPQCRQPFKLEEIRPYVPPQVPMRYCLDITCKPDSGCKKLHIDDLCPKLERPRVAAEKVKEDLKDKVESFKFPLNASYCFDITCPGGKNAKCGKKHESDLLIGPLAS